MSVFKCKMCGGTVEFTEGSSVGVCDSCGTKQTLPRLDDERKANLYDRANHFRRNNDFDKAMAIYEQILNEDNTDAEAYWSLVLCRYGIEYVEDPSNHKRVPTINRTQFTSIYADENYKSALQYADGAQRYLYEAEAKAIDNIQKGILEISRKEEPFDVFICYKETDQNGRRTQDSVLANELYHGLVQEGFKVFFSRITLEDKLGTAYEPYIFAALNSAKVMVVLGTRQEYFNAVWVKNEWSRYLALIKNGAKKMLIPAYRDMDPYNLPDEFSHLQAQDMSKLGFMQDLIRGIKKIIDASGQQKTVKETVVVNNIGTADAAPLLKRAFMFLEDGEWEEANSYFERVLDQDPENAQAYLGKLMAELHVRKQEQLKNCAEPFSNNNNYLKVLRFGNNKLKNELADCIKFINERNENNRLTSIYNGAVNSMEAATTEEEYKAAAEAFKSIGKFKDSAMFAEQCLDKAEICRKDAIYERAMYAMQWGCSYDEALELFESISGWKDADEQAERAKEKKEASRINAEQKAQKAEERRARIKKTNKRLLTILIIVAPILIIFMIVYIPEAENKKINQAINMLYAKDYRSACALLEPIEKNKLTAPRRYEEAVKFIGLHDYEAAYILIRGLARIPYEGSEEKLHWLEQRSQRLLLSGAEIGSTFLFGSYEQDGQESNGKEPIEWQILAKEDDKVLLISKYILAYKQYHHPNTSVTWANCVLRRWLNETFFNDAFSKEEKASICETKLAGEKYTYPKYVADSSNTTTDKVFLLSVTEAEKYFSADEARKGTVTVCCGSYRISLHKGTDFMDYVNECGKNCDWFLRSPSYDPTYATYVSYEGKIGAYGDPNGYDENEGCGMWVCSHAGVRPALWVNVAP